MDGLTGAVIASRNEVVEGVNRGEGVDSWQRYIYIHGAPQAEIAAGIGSIGCVRMSNEHVADLFERVPVGTTVEIS